MARSPLVESDPDQHIRVAALDAIQKLSRQWAGKVPWAAISAGFRAGGQTVLFANRAKGIFKPRQMSAALSIRTGVPRVGRPTWYRDQEIDSASLDGATGLLRYDLARGGLHDATNRALQEAWRRRAPLIYFIGIAPAAYRPIFPVRVADFRLDAGHALLATDDFEFVEARPGEAAREGIVPDADGGPPSVRNGICMSALHHVAFDSHLLGVDPDFGVHVSSQLQEEQDGELLAELKGLRGARLGLPADPNDWPRRDFLERRYACFRESGC